MSFATATTLGLQLFCLADMARIGSRLRTARGIWLVCGMEPVWVGFLLFLSARNQGYVTGGARSGLLRSHQETCQTLLGDAAVGRWAATKAALRLFVTHGFPGPITFGLQLF